jgi:hypothetical protein
MPKSGFLWLVVALASLFSLLDANHDFHANVAASATVTLSVSQNRQRYKFQFRKALLHPRCHLVSAKLPPPDFDTLWDLREVAESQLFARGIPS